MAPLVRAAAAGEGPAQGIERTGLEGMVSKRLGSHYRSGPSKEWRKAKCYSEDVFDVAGVLREPGMPAMALTASKGKYVGGALFRLPKICQRLAYAIA